MEVANQIVALSVDTPASRLREDESGPPLVARLDPRRSSICFGAEREACHGPVRVPGCDAEGNPYRFEEPVITGELRPPRYEGDLVSAPGPTGQGPSADLKRSEALLREARAALRRLDTLMSNAQAAQDPVTPLVAEARSGLERVVGQLARRRSTDERRRRAASKKKTRER